MAEWQGLHMNMLKIVGNSWLLTSCKVNGLVGCLSVTIKD